MARIPIYERQVGAPNVNIASGMADGSAAAPFTALRQFGDALNMIGQVIEREREIEAFVAQQYWSVTGLFEMAGTPFKARLSRWRGNKTACCRSFRTAAGTAISCRCRRC